MQRNTASNRRSGVCTSRIITPGRVTWTSRASNSVYSLDVSEYDVAITVESLLTICSLEGWSIINFFKSAFSLSLRARELLEILS